MQWVMVIYFDQNFDVGDDAFGGLAKVETTLCVFAKVGLLLRREK